MGQVSANGDPSALERFARAIERAIPSFDRGARAIAKRLDRRRWAVPLLAVIAIVFTSPLYEHPMGVGFGDWVWFHFIWDSARKTIVEFGELPFWNPYHCGGNIAWANPNNFGASPLFWLLSPLPAAVGIKVFLTLMTFLGAWGAYELVRRFYARGAWPVFAAVFFACSGYLGWHMNGQTGMTNLQLLPWAFYFYLRGRRVWTWALASGGVLAMMAVTSGIYPLIVTSVGMLAHGIVSAWGGGPMVLLRYAKSGAIACASCVVYSAYKALPMADFLRDHERARGAGDFVTFPILFRSLVEKHTVHDHIWTTNPQFYGWWGEYGNYIGWGGIALLVMALWHAGRRLRRERWLVVIAVALALGDHGSYSPYAMLRELPMFDSFRVPTRHLIVADLWVAALISATGRAIAHWGRRPSAPFRRGWLVMCWALAAWVGADMILTNGLGVFRDSMPTPPPPRHVKGAIYKQVRDDRGAMINHLPLGEGTIDCWEELTVGVAASLRANALSEVYFADTSASTTDSVGMTEFSPNRWTIHASLETPRTVVLNQNAYRGWRTSAGELLEYGGLLAVRLPAGDHDVEVSYVPPGLGRGVALTLGGLALTSIVLVVRRRKRRREKPR